MTIFLTKVPQKYRNPLICVRRMSLCDMYVPQETASNIDLMALVLGKSCKGYKTQEFSVFYMSNETEATKLREFHFIKA